MTLILSPLSRPNAAPLQGNRICFMPRSMISAQRGLGDPLPIFEPMPLAIRIREAIGLSASRTRKRLYVREIIGHNGVAVANFCECHRHEDPYGEETGKKIIAHLPHGAT
jgi:hypothetical protein